MRNVSMALQTQRSDFETDCNAIKICHGLFPDSLLAVACHLGHVAAVSFPVFLLIYFDTNTKICSITKGMATVSCLTTFTALLLKEVMFWAIVAEICDIDMSKTFSG